MRLIDADKLVRDIKLAERSMVEHPPGMFAMSTQAAIDAINIQRTVDAEPVVHAHWMNPHWYNSVSCADCSNCENTSYHTDYHGVQDNYQKCPFCGALMDEEANHETN